jgi:hypothetical protein
LPDEHEAAPQGTGNLPSEIKFRSRNDFANSFSIAENDGCSTFLYNLAVKSRIAANFRTRELLFLRKMTAVRLFCTIWQRKVEQPQISAPGSHYFCGK